MINLHYAFRESMTETLKTRITATGISPKILDRIIARADKLYEANIRQEGAKVTARAMNNETIDFCNELYKEVVGICKIAYSFYSKNPEKRSHFSFSLTFVCPSPGLVHPFSAFVQLTFAFVQCSFTFVHLTFTFVR